MKIACLGGGPAGLYFAISMKLRDRRARHHRVRAQPARRHVRLGRRVLRRDLRQHRRQRSAQRRDHPRPFRLLGRHRGLLSRRSASSRAATAFPASRARSCCMLLQERARELGVELALPDRDRQRRRACQELRSRRRRRRTEFEDAQRIRRRISSRPSTCARTNSSGSARSRNSTTPSPSSSRRPSTAGSGRTPISSTPTPRPSSSNARRRPSRNSASAR